MVSKENSFPVMILFTSLLSHVMIKIPLHYPVRIQSHLILYYYISSYLELFYLILSCTITSHLISHNSISSYPVLFCLILSRTILSHLTLYYSVSSLFYLTSCSTTLSSLLIYHPSHSFRILNIQQQRCLARYTIASAR